MCTYGRRRSKIGRVSTLVQSSEIIQKAITTQIKPIQIKHNELKALRLQLKSKQKQKKFPGIANGGRAA